MSKMPYSPKLKKAMEEIKHILKIKDIGAIVILHDDSQHSEFLMKVNPSYSCLSFNGDQLRTKSKLSEYNGDEQKQVDQLTASVNMIIHFADITKHINGNMNSMIKMLKEKMDIEFGNDDISSHTTQNN